MKIKTKAREFALQFIYHLEFANLAEAREELLDSEESFRERVALFRDSLDDGPSEDLIPFSSRIIHESLSNHSHFEKLIQKYSKNWKFSRISQMNRCILLIAMAEILVMKETPHSIVINEAIELTKKYSTQDSPAFINGLLDKIAKNESVKAT